MSYTEQTDVYITRVLYQQSAYPDSSVPVFNELDTSFRSIEGIKYENFHVNRAECRFSDSFTREQLLIFLKNVTLDGVSFLSDVQSTSLRNSLMSILNVVADITYFDVEIRTSREDTL